MLQANLHLWTHDRSVGLINPALYCCQKLETRQAALIAKGHLTIAAKPLETLDKLQTSCLAKSIKQLLQDKLKLWLFDLLLSCEKESINRCKTTWNCEYSTDQFAC